MTKPFKCKICGRRFSKITAHNCKGGFRKHHLKDLFEYAGVEGVNIVPFSHVFTVPDEVKERLSEYEKMCINYDIPKMTPTEKQESPLDRQVGGDHYKKYKIQPIEFIMANGLDYCQANAIKYLLRHNDKNGKEDLQKAIHYIELMIEHYYPEKK